MIHQRKIGKMGSDLEQKHFAYSFSAFDILKLPLILDRKEKSEEEGR